MLMWKYILALMIHIQQTISSSTGTLLPEQPNSVQPYRTNEGAVGNYTFYFRMSSSLVESPRFTVDFPVIYNDVLADMSTCIAEVYIVQTDQTIELACSISGKRVAVS